METWEPFARYADIAGTRLEPSRAWQGIKPHMLEIFQDIHMDLALLKILYVQVAAFLYDRSHLVTTLLNVSPLDIEAFERDSSRPIDLGSRLTSTRRANFSLTFILAPIGRGKTTFLWHQLHIDWPKMFPRIQWHPIIVDVLDCQTGKAEYVASLRNGLDDAIRSAYPCFRAETDADLPRVHAVLCHVFSDDLRAAGIPTSSNSENKDATVLERQRGCWEELKKQRFSYYHKKLLEHGRKESPAVRIVLAVDNLDQHMYFQSKRQEFILDAHALAREVDVPLIITLRDTSFRTNNPLELLASFATADYICLQNVPVEEILAVRFAHLATSLEQDTALDQVSRSFVRVLARQFDPSNPNPILKSLVSGASPWIGNISNQSKRSALQSAKKALESKLIMQDGFDKNIRRVEELEVLRGSIHGDKLKRALLLHNSRFFDGDRSMTNVVNLFDCETPTWQVNNVFRLKVLQYLDRLKSEGTLLSALCDLMERVVGREHRFRIRTTLRILVEKGLIAVYLKNQTDDAMEYIMGGAPIDLEKYLNCQGFITHNGNFHITHLLYDLVYLEEMKFATYLDPVVYSAVFDEYTPGGPQPNMGSRIDSTRAFIRFLQRVEKDVPEIDRNLGVEAIMPTVLEEFEARVREMWAVRRERETQR